MNKIKCIYTIKDKRNNKIIYIGQTKDFEQRKSHHFSTTLRPIDKFMFEQGRDNFVMFILELLNEDISIEEMRNKEQDYIEKYDTYLNGLNVRNSGNLTKNKEHIKEIGKLWSQNNRERRRETNKFWYENNKEKKKETSKFWYENNRERKRETSKIWSQNNREKKNEYSRRYRLKKKLEKQQINIKTNVVQ